MWHKNLFETKQVLEMGKAPNINIHSWNKKKYKTLRNNS
jgi:hypothetical protein